MSRFLYLFLIAGAVVLGTVAHGLAQAPATPSGNMLVYIGTYTNGTKSKGIYVSKLDTEAGTLSPAELAAETASPSFLAVHPNEKYLYAVNETTTYADETGGVSAFEINRSTGMLRTLGQQSSEGAGPAHLSVDKGGKNVLVANYGGGSVVVLPINRDGGLKSGSFFAQHKGHSVNPQRQKEPHAHSITMDPAGRFAYVADLGLDWIVIYQLDERKGLLKLADPPNVKVDPGSGPRHFSVHPSGRFGYVINEINVHRLVIHRQSDHRRVETAGDRIGAPAQGVGAIRLQRRRTRRASVGTLSLHIDSRPQQHRGLHDR